MLPCFFAASKLRYRIHCLTYCAAVLGPGGELKLFPGCDQIEFDFLCCGPSDGDKNIAYFKSSWEWGTFDGLTFLEHSEWATWTAPLLTTTIRGLCNDTEIVDLSTQLPKISCDWKRTLSRLFGEETRVEKQADQLSRRLANIPVGPRTIKHHCYMSQRRQRIEKQCEAAEARHRWSLAKADLRLKWVDTSFWSSVAEERMRLWSRNGGVSENKIGEEQIRLEVMCSYREQGMRFTEFSR